VASAKAGDLDLPIGDFDLFLRIGDLALADGDIDLFLEGDNDLAPSVASSSSASLMTASAMFRRAS
jgi:hypothetical protein